MGEREPVTRVYAFANQKGGVGKTTTAVNLGAYLSAAGRRVLLVDADPQANATSSLGIEPASVRYSIYDTLIRQRPLADTLVPTRHPELLLAPSTPALAGAEVEMVSLLAREYLLRKALDPILEQWDYIFIDCPPSLGLLTVNALAAAKSGVIVPIQCEYLALEGLGRLWGTIQLVREHLNTHFPAQTFRTIIPRSIRLSEAPSYGQTILTYAPDSPGGIAYAALAEEFLVRVEADSTSP
jgi:chromosome partitioning protein